MKISKIGFTLVELLIYIMVSSILLYWVFFVFNVTSSMISESQRFVAVYEQIDDMEKHMEKIDQEYIQYTFATGSVFGKSEIGFQSCLFTNSDNSKGYIVGVVNKDTGAVVIGNITNVARLKPFTAEVSSGIVNTIMTNKNISSTSLSGAKVVYYDVNMLKFTCNKKKNYIKFDFVIQPDIKDTDIWMDLTTWNKDTNNRKISFSILK